MRYAEPLSNQLQVFITSIGFGVLSGLLYEVFSVLRRLAGNKKKASVICDFSFCVIVTVLSFFYMVIYNNGIVRLNLIMAQLAGGIAFHLSMGRYIRKPLYFLMDILRKVTGFIFYPIKILLNKLQNTISTFLTKHQKAQNEEQNKKKTDKKIKNIAKILLKK